MAIFGTVKHQKPVKEILHINKPKGHVKATCNKLIYRDKDTRHIVVYVPSLELSGYGATEKKAEEMLRFSIDDMFTHLCQLPSEKMVKELAKLGWKKDKLKAKEFSKAYIDGEGNLKDFNAVGDRVDVKYETMTV